MKHVLLVVALVAGMVAIAGSATAATAPKAYPGKDGLIAFRQGVQIYTIRPNGSGLKELTRSGKNYTPVWNPAGTEIAYEHESPGHVWNIWVMRAGGSNKRQWTNTGTTYGSPAWSPSGKTLLFTTGGQRGDIGDDIWNAAVAAEARALRIQSDPQWQHRESVSDSVTIAALVTA